MEMLKYQHWLIFITLPYEPRYHFGGAIHAW